MRDAPGTTAFACASFYSPNSNSPTRKRTSVTGVRDSLTDSSRESFEVFVESGTQGFARDLESTAAFTVDAAGKVVEVRTPIRVLIPNGVPLGNPEAIQTATWGRASLISRPPTQGEPACGSPDWLRL